MPLFTYKCPECEHSVEKFQHNSEDIEVICQNCGHNCEKQMPFSHNRTWLDAKEYLKEKILPDADRIKSNIAKGKDKDFFDLYGDK